MELTITMAITVETNSSRTQSVIFTMSMVISLAQPRRMHQRSPPAARMFNPVKNKFYPQSLGQQQQHRHWSFREHQRQYSTRRSRLSTRLWKQFRVDFPLQTLILIMSMINSLAKGRRRRHRSPPSSQMLNQIRKK